MLIENHKGVSVSNGQWCFDVFGFSRFSDRPRGSTATGHVFVPAFLQEVTLFLATHGLPVRPQG